MITYGRLSCDRNSTAVGSVVSCNICAISSRRISLSSDVLTYLSRFTRSWIRSMISRVVSTPTSEAISVSSRLSSTSSSMVDLPATTRVSFSKKPERVFSNPLSRFCCCCCCSSSLFSFEPKNLKKPIVVIVKTAKIHIFFQFTRIVRTKSSIPFNKNDNKNRKNPFQELSTSC